MRPFTVLFIAAAGCAPSTQLDVASKSLPGATVSTPGESAVIGTSGTAQLSLSPPLQGGDVTLSVARGGQQVSLVADCVEPVGPVEPVQEIELSLRRRISDGACALLIDSMRTSSGTFPGGVNEALYDDAPCGAWAATP